MQSTCTSFDDLALLFGQSVEGEIRPTVGKVVAMEIAPRRLAPDTKEMTRAAALQLSREAERWITFVLDEAAREAANLAVSESLSMWAGRVSVTDLKEVSDEMLTQIPTFSDPLLASLPFHAKFLPPDTQRLDVPLLPQHADVWPKDFEEMLMPWAEAERLLAIKEDFEFQQLMASGTATE
jgi:hypothetical protein